jgi:hypothetical protein
MVTKEELIEELGNIDVCHCTLSDGSTCDIGEAGYWIGGGDGYMCDMLGNVEYDSVPSVVNALFAYISGEGLTMEEIF